MKYIITSIIIGLFLLGVVCVISNNNNVEFMERDISIIYLKPSEISEIKKLRDEGFNGIISIPEKKFVYGKTEFLEYQEEVIKKEISKFNKI